MSIQEEVNSLVENYGKDAVLEAVLNCARSDGNLVIPHTIEDSCSGSSTYRQEVECIITGNREVIKIEVKNYEETMCAWLEYYDGKLEVLIWGEQSLDGGKDEADIVLITDRFREFCQRLDQLQ